MNSSIDVIIPVFNGEKYIRDAIDSAINQTCKPAQIIVVDDGSTDNTESIVKASIEVYTLPIIYLRKNNGGLSSARNAGIKICSSQYIALLDADDIWEPTKLEKQLTVFHASNNNNLGVVYCDYSNIDSKGQNIDNFSCFKLDTEVKGIVFERLLYGNKVASSGSGVLVKKECFDQTGLFDESLPTCEDWDMWLRISRLYEFDYVNEKLVRLRRHNHNMSKDNLQMIIGEVLLFNKLAAQDELDKNILSGLRYEILRRSIMSLPDGTFWRNINQYISTDLRRQLYRERFDVVRSILGCGVRRIIRVIKLLIYKC